MRISAGFDGEYSHPLIIKKGRVVVKQKLITLFV